MDNNNHITFKKIPLSVLISALHDAWNNGADFIDLSGTANEEQDFISITVRKEYIDSDKNDESFDFTIEKDIDPGPINNDEDLNLLSDM